MRDATGLRSAVGQSAATPLGHPIGTTGDPSPAKVGASPF